MAATRKSLNPCNLWNPWNPWFLLSPFLGQFSFTVPEPSAFGMVLARCAYADAGTGHGLLLAGLAGLALRRARK